MNVTRLIVDHLLGKNVPNEKLQHIAAVLDDSNWRPYVSEPLLLNLKQAAQLLGCSRSYFWLLRRRGLVPTVRLGDSMYLRYSDLDQLVKVIAKVKMLMTFQEIAEETKGAFRRSEDGLGRIYFRSFIWDTK